MEQKSLGKSFLLLAVFSLLVSHWKGWEISEKGSDQDDRAIGTEVPGRGPK